jgi:UPF0755 protein
MMAADSLEHPPQPQSWLRLTAGLIILLGVVFTAWLWYALSPAGALDEAVHVTIAEGVSAATAVGELERAGLVRSPLLFHALLVLFFDPGEIKAGTHTFTTVPGTYALAARLTGTAPPGATVTLTLPEGFTAREYATLAGRVLNDLDVAEFVSLATPHEGFLFPDTYLVPPDFTETALLELLRDTYDERTAALAPAIAAHPLSLTEVVTLASLLEREANSEASKRMVSGILQSRLRLGMPLQADASIEYVLNKPLTELTPADLETDSPYNTYLNRGLPPTPIGNPGLTAIEAVLAPTESPYLFYITGNDGAFYYAETYAEHQQNIERYLR